MLAALHCLVLEDERVALIAAIVSHFELTDTRFHEEARLSLLQLKSDLLKERHQHPVFRGVLLRLRDHLLLVLRLKLENDLWHGENETEFGSLGILLLLLFLLLFLFLSGDLGDL